MEDLSAAPPEQNPGVVNRFITALGATYTGDNPLSVDEAAKIILMNLIRQPQLKILYKRAEKIVNEIETYLAGEEILDVGSGGGTVARIIKARNFSVTTLDIADKSHYEEEKPIIYNGKKFPFDNKSFDTSLILFVLHHAAEPVNLIKEAKRVSKKRIIIKEDIYRNQVELFLTKVGDSIVNFEFFNHPHNNLKDSQWKKIFKQLDLKLVKVKYNRAVFLFFPFYQATYVLEIIEN